MRLSIRSTLRAVLVLGGLVGGVGAVAGAQQGTVAGRVTDQANGQPLVGARVTIMGTSLIAQTNAEGRYTLPRVPGGQLTVRATAVGFGAGSRVVSVNPGETAVVDLALALSPYSVDEVVITATGDQAKKEVGNSIARIDASKLVETAPITNVTDLLIAKAAGVDVLPGTVTGAPSRVRIRGTNSLSLTNEPVYVLDGIRITSQNRSSGACVQDSVSRFNLFQDPQTTPLGTGHRQQYGVQVSGGSDAVRYYVSGEWEDEVGQAKMPLFADSIVRAIRQISEVPGDQRQPNALRRTSIRANVAANPSPRIDLEGSTTFITSKLRIPPTDNNTTGLLSNALGGPGNKNNGRYGYRVFTPNEMFSEALGQDVNRFIGSGTGRWRPTSWLAFRAIGGVDYASRLDTDLCMRTDCVNFATIKDGF